ncbi:MAG TPA: deoxyribose-phosphate aldolase [Azospirillaceae bacterium]|nr:deoxyribose-phosphate aldolase [Azospirillaceae bacterium]
MTLSERLIPLIDLTSLNDGDTAGIVASLCRRAVTPKGRVAAVCVWPRFVAQAKADLSGTGVKVATVVNFPSGAADAVAVAAETAQAVGDGADEIDMVLPYRRFLAGDRATAGAVLKDCRNACGGARLKVILESGAFTEAAELRAAADLAIAAGADFLKTSTGKIATGATLEAAAVMLEAIRASGCPVGFKASGGIREVGPAARYLDLADRLMGAGWATPRTFRFGASGLLDALVASDRG